MRQFQCEVVGVADGAAAVAARREKPFDLIFLDVHMPSVGGIQATQEIRRRRHSGFSGPRGRVDEAGRR